ncbi:MAG: DUF1501 domain-containing protein [Planctomycetia bacterium]|nr:DUF1501 domain-containing protein [Planctomycetia bacterium]
MGGGAHSGRIVKRTMGSACRSFLSSRFLSRREVLRVGGLAGFGLSLPGVLRAREIAVAPKADGNLAATFGKAKHVIVLYLHGGHPQQETFDPKPEGPAELRGEFGAIASSLAGVQVSELLPRTATIMHKLATVRSMSHRHTDHVIASMPALTGHPHPPEKDKLGDFPPSPTDYPPHGAVLSAIRPAQGGLPTWMRVGPLMRRMNGTVLHGQSPGLLGNRHASFVVDQELLPADVRIEAVQPIADLTELRLTARLDLLKQVDRQQRLIDQSAGVRTFDEYYQRAFNLIGSAATHKAFRLADESPEMRARYGKTEFGQRCLLARRLAEAGVPMTYVSYCHTPAGSWDTHSNHFPQMKKSLAPTFDSAFTALVNDLDERGMLDETLVIAMAEFGRTPQINKSGGRDHWPFVYSVAFAGAGIRAGTVYGSSDSAAAYPASDPRGPADFCATVYHLLGVPPDTAIHDQQGRPHNIIIGEPIAPILA